MAAVLERQLILRFGPLSGVTRAQLDGAPPEQLVHWVDRILDAPTIDAVFQTQSGKPSPLRNTSI